MDAFIDGLLPALRREENNALIKQYKETKDLALKEKIVAHNLRLISLTINNYFCSVDLQLHDDMFAEGIRGLSDAIEKFDPSQEFAFSSYAVPAIKRKITRFLCLEEKHKGIVSLDNPVEGDNGEQDTSLVEFFPSDEDILEEQTEKIDIQEKMKVVNEYLSTLKPNQREMFLRAWGIGRKKETHNVIALDMGITHQRVAQIVTRIMKDLQRYFLVHAKLSEDEKIRMRKVVVRPSIEIDID